MKDGEQWSTDLSKEDAEAVVPKLPEGNTSAESLFSMEALGVLPPLDRGWKPKSEAIQKGKSMWLTHNTAADWIYNMTEDKYFHLPSKSFWEKRPLESQDPKAPPYTYVRMDAFHLQALRHFAASLETAALPLAWKSWTLFVRKKKVAVQIAAEAPTVEEVPTSAGAGPHVDENLQLPSEHEESRSEATEVEDAKEPEGEEPTQETPAPVPAPLPEVRQSAVTTPSRKPKRGFCGCLRASPVESDEESEEATLLPASEPEMPKPISEMSTITVVTPQERASDTSSHAGVSPQKETPTTPAAVPKPEVPKNIYSVDDLHTHRLENFLAEIGRNPQRLVIHVDRRRDGKTAIAFM
ncbi:unnamed protein product [Effrenium voratum]|nr:unnamed protein product [Effrenium voratum]